jgi:hypothetical protein
MFQEQMKSLTLDFEPIPVTYRLTVKLLCYAMLSGELPINESRPGVASIRRHLVELKRFTVWLDQQWPRLRCGCCGATDPYSRTTT